MITIFLILIILSSILLAAIVLIQNPKGGGLSGSIAGLSNQFMGVKQTTDVLEKGTWILSGVLITLCIVSTLFVSSTKTISNDAIKNIPTNTPSTQQQVIPVQPSALDTNAK
jgi:preprotein translocase subunit SecG